MMRTLGHYVLLARSLAVAVAMFGTVPAWSAEFWLEARPLSASEQPAGVPTTVPMWGYALCDAQWSCSPASVPGPQLVVPAGDTVLTIHLKNSLPATGLSVPNMTSIVMPGQRETGMAPVMFPPEPNPHDGGATTRVRMRSFTHETAPGQVGDYVWSDLKPGTYLYHSGTHPQVQVQMGLYGSVKADAAPGHAYLGQTYATDTTLLFSEIDPVLHTEVANGTYGTAGHPTSTISYQPKYFLVNGSPFSSTTTPIPAGNAGQRTLLRLLNAGLETHVPTLLGGRFQVIAEDGHPLTHPRDQYETLLPAAKTIDAIWIPAANGIYPIYDRRNRQGMLAKLEIGVGSAPPTAVSDAYSTPVDTPLSLAAPGVLANDQNPSSNPLTAVLVSGPANGTLNFAANGGFDYTPPTGFFGPVTFTYRANNGADSNVATVTITVNRRPVAVDDTATTQPDNPVTVNVLANDSDPDNQPLTITAVTAGTHGTVTTNGMTVTYKPNADYNGTDSFTYTISDGQAPTPGTASGTVTMTITPVNDAPVAVANVYAVNKQTIFTVPAPGVLANDSDVDGDLLTADQRSNPSGTVSLNADGSFSYTTTSNYVGTRVFKYRATDGLLNSAVVNVTLVKDLTVSSITRAINGDWIIGGKSTKPNTTVEVFASPAPGSNSIGTVTVSGNGRWSLRVGPAVLSSGQQISLRASYGELIEVPVP